MIAQCCKFTRNNWTVHLKQVNCMVCKLHLKLLRSYLNLEGIKCHDDDFIAFKLWGYLGLGLGGHSNLCFRH